MKEGLYNDVSMDIYKGYKRESSRDIFRIGFDVSMRGLTSTECLYY